MVRFKGSWLSGLLTLAALALSSAEAMAAPARAQADLAASDLTVDGTVIAATGFSVTPHHFPGGATYPVGVTLSNHGTAAATFYAELATTYATVGGWESLSLGFSSLDLEAGASTTYGADWNTAGFPGGTTINILGIAWPLDGEVNQDDNSVVGTAVLGDADPGSDITPPSVPLILSPANGAVVKDGWITLEWSRSVDDRPGVITYVCNVGASGAFQRRSRIRIGAYDNTGTTRRIYVGGGAGEGQVTWNVHAVDAAGNQSATSETSSFTVISLH